MRNDPEEAASGIHRSVGIEPFLANDPVSAAIDTSAGAARHFGAASLSGAGTAPRNPDVQGTLNAG
jgi:hypothetical protein